MKVCLKSGVIAEFVLGEKKFKVTRTKWMRTDPVTLEMTLPLHISHERFVTDCQRWVAGEAIQTALRYMSADEREFLMTGILPGEFDKAFPER